MSGSDRTSRPDGRGSGSDGGVAAGALVVLTVTETVVAALTGRDGCRYTSPPQTREQAAELACLLLGRDLGQLDGESRWQAPIAGGRRTVSIEPV